MQPTEEFENILLDFFTSVINVLDLEHIELAFNISRLCRSTALLFKEFKKGHNLHVSNNEMYDTLPEGVLHGMFRVNYKCYITTAVYNGGKNVYTVEYRSYGKIVLMPSVVGENRVELRLVYFNNGNLCGYLNKISSITNSRGGILVIFHECTYDMFDNATDVHVDLLRAYIEKYPTFTFHT